MTAGRGICAFETLTAAEEVGYHRTRELGYVGIYEDEAHYMEFLADFIGDFPDIRDEPDHPALTPDPDLGYPQGQVLAASLRREGHRGLLYPSVRRPGGVCFVAYRSGHHPECLAGGAMEADLEGDARIHD
ncbi:RES family NAD+ phosphorylase [Breoghania sp.]|uniref:RES family NAD+ phosphorylase n=1 Tax=Breoghania sp. TaxID=2065378 RepID=UPI00320470F9